MRPHFISNAHWHAIDELHAPVNGVEMRPAAQGSLVYGLRRRWGARRAPRPGRRDPRTPRTDGGSIQRARLPVLPTRYRSHAELETRRQDPLGPGRSLRVVDIREGVLVVNQD
jgi:hypothetical protein